MGMHADKPRDFDNPARQRTGRLTGSASRTILTCVDQKFVSYWEVVTRILIFCGYCLFWSAKFARLYKSIVFDLVWSVKVFLRLNTNFRLFNLFSKVPPGSEYYLKAIFFCQRMRWFPAMFCHAGSSSLVFFAGCFKILSDGDLQIQISKNGLHLKLKLQLHCDSVNIAL